LVTLQLKISMNCSQPPLDTKRGNKMSAVQAKSRMVDFVNLVFGLVFSAVAGKKFTFYR